MDRYSEMFARLNDKNEGAFVPFVMIGDPDLATSEAIICQLIEAFSQVLERFQVAGNMLQVTGKYFPAT